MNTFTRRGGIGAGTKLAFVAPAVVAALRAGVAHADSNHGRHGDHDDKETPPGLEIAAQHARVANVSSASSASSKEIRQQALHVTYRAGLCRVSDVQGGTGGTDFAATNAAGTPDQLTAGALRVVASSDSSQAGRVFIRLEKAVANATYNVYFERLQDHGRESIGQVATDANGNFRGFVAAGNNGNGMLSGDHRVGAFVLTRNDGGTERDEFVTCIRTH